METKLVFITLTCLACWNLRAQPQDKLQLHAGHEERPVPWTALRAPGPDNRLAGAVFQDSWLLILQFSALPPETERSRMSKAGIQLFDYLDGNAFAARVPAWVDLQRYGVKSAYTLSAATKLSPELRRSLGHGNAGQAELLVRIFPGLQPSEILQGGLPLTWRVEEMSGLLRIRLPWTEMAALAARPWAYYLEPWPKDPVLEGWGARGIHQTAPSGGAGLPGLDGSGVTLVFSDDGFPEHPDFQDALIRMSSRSGSHVYTTTGMALGRGHLDPQAQGIAPGARALVTDIQGYAAIFNAAKWYSEFRAVLSSNSFADNWGGWYTNMAALLDEVSIKVPKAGHIFSAGNSAALNSGNAFGALIGPDGARFGNITGGMKAGKNGLAVGNIGADWRLNFLSSRGPVADGRLKPDLCALGEGDRTPALQNSYQLSRGTSAAAPVVAGIAGLMYQEYRRLFSDQDPDFALVKALLMATANDLGRPGPDYDYGFGAVNAKAAVQALRKGWFTQGAVRHGQTAAFPLQVPAGVKQLKVMLYWHDAPASPLASRALVNDLDISLVQPDGKTVLPLSLSAFPHADSLAKPAAPGFDRLNNAELAVLDLPAAGPYQIQVSGFSVPQGPQDFYLVYYLDEQPLEWVYPAGDVAFTPGETVRLRWSASQRITAPFQLDYSTNGGQTWERIASLSALTRFMDWTLPEVHGANLQWRITQGNAQAISAVHTVLGVPQFRLRAQGPQSVEVSWESVPGATAYEVFLLQNGVMRSLGTTTANAHSAGNLAAGQTHWISVRALAPQKGLSGRRAIAQSFQTSAAPNLLSVQITLATGIACHGSSTGALEANAQGGTGTYTFTWSNGQRSKKIDNLPAGYYEITVNDGQSTATATYRLESPPALEMAFSYKMPACFQGTDGGIEASGSGGVPPYTWQWSTGGTAAQLSGVAAGVYTVTLTDGKGCRVVRSALLEQPAALKAQLQVDPAKGKVSVLSASGGTPPYTYWWPGGYTTSEPQTFSPGAYSLTVRDSRGCSKSFPFEVPDSPERLEYCPVRTTTSLFEWIEEVRIGNFSHRSGNNNGIGDFLAQTIRVSGGMGLPLQLTGGFRRKSYPENWYVWADLNLDGDFEDVGELIFEAYGKSEVQGGITFPVVDQILNTRIRIAMSYGLLAGPCDRINYGEAEEYGLQLLPKEGASGIVPAFPVQAQPSAKTLLLYPNPAQDLLHLEWRQEEGAQEEILLWNMTGVPVRRWQFRPEAGWNSFEADLSGLPAGAYLIEAGGEKRLVLKK